MGNPELQQLFDYKLRISGDLRQRIERAAAASGVERQREMARRLRGSFDYGPTRTLEEIAGDMDAVWARYGKVFHDLSARGDLVRATEVLVEAVEQLPAATQKPLKEAIERVKAATSVINMEATAAMRRLQDVK